MADGAARGRALQEGEQVAAGEDPEMPALAHLVRERRRHQDVPVRAESRVPRHLRAPRDEPVVGADGMEHPGAVRPQRQPVPAAGRAGALLDDEHVVPLPVEQSGQGEAGDAGA
ncbi:hypothetical protein U5M74_01805 [Puerhibacterium sp. TATVAM-FAB25]